MHAVSITSPHPDWLSINSLPIDSKRYFFQRFRASIDNNQSKVPIDSLKVVVLFFQRFRSFSSLQLNQLLLYTEGL